MHIPTIGDKYVDGKRTSEVSQITEIQVIMKVIDQGQTRDVCIPIEDFLKRRKNSLKAGAKFIPATTKGKA